MLRLFRCLSLHVLCALCGLLFLNACRSYVPAPVDWAREAADWSATATNRTPLTLAEARQLALILNPEINAFRLSRLSSDRLALASGWWEDPAIDLDGLRLLKGGPHPLILGGGLTFTLPVNGVPGIEKRAAQAYARADALAVTVAEQRLLSEVDSLWNACQTDRRCAALQSAYKEQLAAREKQIRAWVTAGELPRTESERIAREHIELDLACACCRAESAERRQAFLRLLGLHPAAPVELADTEDSLNGSPPVFDTASSAFGALPETDLDLVRHPLVREKLARLDASEDDLLAEIRKQYPDLTIGPRYEHEDGSARLGLSAGMTLPLWNRNRKGIAAAESGRDAARLEAVNAWRGLVAEWHEARRLLRTAEEKERRIREELLPAALAAAARAERLLGHGEADVTEVVATERSLYEVRESLLEARKDLAEAHIRLRRLHAPRASAAQK